MLAEGQTPSGKAEGKEPSAQSNQLAAPSISLPKGGGAIRGMGEKFAANPVTGTGSMSLPIATSPGRSGFGPQLALSYDSGAANGPFGFGWSLSLPAITRKTDKGLPQYFDSEESDVFVLSGTEDLVPMYRQDAGGSWVASHAGHQRDPDGFWVRDQVGRLIVHEDEADGYRVRRYRPRIEGLFARIERWTGDNGDVHWRSLSKDNILTLYGKDAGSRIFDPEDPSRIFSWLICETRDDKGNAVLYEYKPEDGVGVDLSRANERNRGDRDDPRRGANRYLKHIRYGNRLPLLDNAGQRPLFLTDAQISEAGWMFEVVFDYGEHDATNPQPRDLGDWTYRLDPFSTYRAGFEVRTTRLCQRVLMFHHFESEAGVGKDCLVRSTDFTYSYEKNPADARNPIFSFLLSATQTGYRRIGADGYLAKSLPPIEFEYTRPVVQDNVQDVDASSLENLPTGVDGTAYQWTDLHGEGIPGILTEQADAWFYKRNVSPISRRPVDFAPQELVTVKPSLALAGGEVQFMDLAGDGQPDLVILDGPTAGFYEHDENQGWQSFQPFSSRLNRETRDPNLKFVDLDGDGHADVLITEHDALVWHASLAEDGFGPAFRVSQAADEERGPRLVFADGTQSIYLADLSGDGLTDLVRIRNGEVCYWPNLGYGRFGAKVTMDQSPLFDNPDQFDHRRVRLADIDGSGTTDIIYLHRDGVRLYFNQSGNSWSPPQELAVFPRVNDLVSIVPADLLGNGTVCLIWSSPLPGDARHQMRYVDLMGGQKPHLLIRTVNNLGAETRVQYAPSIKFYLQDKRDGRPWITRLPFPVHVVERVETYDRISGNRFVSRYAYHHGYFDGVEREFRGFGMVEQWDTDEIGSAPDEEISSLATNLDAASFVPPVHTKTWFHTGVYLGRDRVSRYFAGLFNGRDKGEYYREPAWGDDDEMAKPFLLDDTVLPPEVTVEEEPEACRALKGSMLRQEVYALDGTEKQDHPYTVTEQNFTIERLQPKADNRHGTFFAHPREALSYHYERNPSDPRVGRAITLEVDKYGNVLKSVSIGYGRRQSPLTEQADQEKQTRTLITFTENVVTNPVDEPDNYRAPLPSETRTYELTGLTPVNNATRFGFDEWVEQGFDAFALANSAAETPYEEPATPGKRLIEHVRTLYRSNDLAGPLPLAHVDSLALPFETYKLALTLGLLSKVYRRPSDVAVPPGENLVPDPAAVLPADLLGGQFADRGGYVDLDGNGNWWIPSGRLYYFINANVANSAATAAQELAEARGHFFQPRKLTDPFGHSTTVDYDTDDLLVIRTVDALGNTVQALHDYRVLQPTSITDPNGNRTDAVCDALGMVVATVIVGKEGDRSGDTLADFEAPPAGTDLTTDEIREFAKIPRSVAAKYLKDATTRIVYDLDRFRRCGQPPFTASLARETHVNHPLPLDGPRIQISFVYSDGFGREIQTKVQAEPGIEPQRWAEIEIAGGDVKPGKLVLENGETKPMPSTSRWVGKGRTVYNNKGRPIKQYEPFFSGTHLYEEEPQMTETGVTPILFYDPLDRVVATLHPNHTYEKVIFDPWRQATWDVNDTVTIEPQSDDDVKGFFLDPSGSPRLPLEEYLLTWHALRTQAAHAAEAGERWPDAKLRDAEKQAAEKAAAHAGTPALAHLDALGRTFLTIADNGKDASGQERKYETRIELDIEGNQRDVIDALGRIVMRYDYDMLGNRIHQASMEAGERWMLNDVTAKPIRAWDSRGFMRRMTYDELRRPTGLYVTENDVERLAERTEYGEGQGTAKNSRTRVYQVFDAAGVVTNEAYDFKGNLLRSRRELLPDYRTEVNWQKNPAPTDGTFTSSTTYDALNRPTAVTTPDNSVYRPTFSEANLLDRVDVNLRGAATATAFVTNIDYNAKGQRMLIHYGNGAETTYEYDDQTFRLVRLKTTRGAGQNGLASQIFKSAETVQDLRYTYDPAGNFTHIEDAALLAIFHDGQQVEPVSDYTYDAVYRLIEASGREHIGQTAFDFDPPNCRDYPFVGHAHPNDLQALRSYTQYYDYDAVGNFDVMRHIANGGGWKRTYAYNEPSLIEGPAKKSNRLSSTTIEQRTEAYAYDAHGNITAMPHLTVMEWDLKDQLRATSRQAVSSGTPETTYYVYDAAGQRVRKVTERQNGTRKNQRIYFGGFEIYWEYDTNAGAVTLERETLHVMDDKQRIAPVETKTVVNDNPINAPVPVERYQLGNHLGSASLELDNAGGLISYEEYHPYGTTACQAISTAAEVSLKRYRYTGKEREEETGLYYHGARYYAPWLGRWLSCDPAGLRGGIDLFSYGADSPITFGDPSGMEPDMSTREKINDTWMAFDPEEGDYVLVNGPELNMESAGSPSKSPIEERRQISVRVDVPGSPVLDRDPMLPFFPPYLHSDDVKLVSKPTEVRMPDGTTRIEDREDVDPGHAWVAFETLDARGNIEIGWYPVVAPENPAGVRKGTQGELHDDSRHNYEFEATFPVSQDAFESALDLALSRGPGNDPKVWGETSGCVDFVYDVMSRAGVSLPPDSTRTVGAPTLGYVTMKMPGALAQAMYRSGQGTYKGAPSGSFLETPLVVGARPMLEDVHTRAVTSQQMAWWGHAVPVTVNPDPP